MLLSLMAQPLVSPLAGSDDLSSAVYPVTPWPVVMESAFSKVLSCGLQFLFLKQASEKGKERARVRTGG